jgi:hypothetical protein
MTAVFTTNIGMGPSSECLHPGGGDAAAKSGEKISAKACSDNAASLLGRGFSLHAVDMFLAGAYGRGCTSNPPHRVKLPGWKVTRMLMLVSFVDRFLQFNLNLESLVGESPLLRSIEEIQTIFMMGSWLLDMIGGGFCC